MSDDRDWREYTRRGALGLMGVGGLAVATETMGITQLTADRGVGVSVEDDANAGVKIVNDNDGSTPIENTTFDGSALIRFENDTSRSIDNIICSLTGDTSNVNFTGSKDFGTSGELVQAEVSSSNFVVLEVNNMTTDATDGGSTESPNLEVDILFGADTVADTSLNLSRTITIDP